MHPVEALLTPVGRLFRHRHAEESLSVSHRPELATSRRIAFASPRFVDGQELPGVYCGRFIGENLSPAVTWRDLPPETTEMLLVMEDLDSPGKSPRLHAVATFPPEPGTLSDGELNSGSSRARFLHGSRGPLAYSGPRPLPGHGPHHYRLHLYALDQTIDIDRLTEVEELAAEVDGHVLASATLTTTHES
ncbi:hypothetical protein GCM10027568_06100 [Humibacter soli]